jgi:Ca2+/Na+ antiporter
VKLNYPRGWYLYGVLTATSSLLILFGMHREFYSLLHDLSLPSLAISGLAGLANLSWYELGYIVGSGVKNVRAFVIIPIVGGLTGFLSALILLTRFRWRRHVLLAHLFISIVIALLGVGVLSWRFVRGFEDPWRLVTAIAFLLMCFAWLLYFHRTRRFFSASLPAH